MPRLYSNLLDGSNRRYFFNLESAPGGIQPLPGVLRFGGFAPVVQPLVEAFRTPAPATLNLLGQTIVNPTRVSPSAALISRVSSAPSLATQIVVTNAFLTPDYSPPNALAPTIAFIQTVTPAPAQLQFQNPPANASPGGDIGYVSPAAGQLSFVSLAPSLIFLEAGPGILIMEGLGPDLITTMTVEPAPGALLFNPLEPSFERPFEWIDEDEPQTTIWTDVTI